MTKNKNKKLFTIKNNKNKINMEVNESNFNHFQSLTPMQQKASRLMRAVIQVAVTGGCIRIM